MIRKVSRMKTRASLGLAHSTDQWQSLVGEYVEVWFNQRPYRQGRVDDAMPDASGLWVAADSFRGREYIDKASGFDVWTTLYPRSPHE